MLPHNYFFFGVRVTEGVRVGVGVLVRVGVTGTQKPANVRSNPGPHSVHAPTTCPGIWSGPSAWHARHWPAIPAAQHTPSLHRPGPQSAFTAQGMPARARHKPPRTMPLGLAHVVQAPVVAAHALHALDHLAQHRDARQDPEAHSDPLLQAAPWARAGTHWPYRYVWPKGHTATRKPRMSVAPPEVNCRVRSALELDRVRLGVVVPFTVMSCRMEDRGPSRKVREAAGS